MSSDPSHYRPRSPDLPALGNQPASQPPQPQPQPPPRLSRLPSYQIQEPSLPKGYSFSPRGSYDASPFFSPITQQPPPSYFNFPPSGSPQAVAASLPGHQSQPKPSYGLQYPQSPQNLSNPTGLDHSGQSLATEPNVSFSQPFADYSSQVFADMARLRQRKPVSYNEDHGGPNEFDEQLPPVPVVNNPSSMHFQGQPPLLHPAPELVSAPQPPPTLTNPGPMVLPKVDVRTKFPVARIKRIMQADEDVGKVAQATPSAVSKALELFMIALVTKGASEAKLQNSKRVTATHLKNALLKDPQFDFLNEVCESAPDEGAKRRGKGDGKESDSEDEGDTKKKSKVRRKKTGSDFDSD